MYKILAAVMFSFTFALTACSTNYNSDEVPDVSPENLYKIAKANMATGSLTTARRYLEAIDSRYPFGDISSQVQLDLIYVYYKERESDLAAAQIARFIRLNPTHPNIDYVYYMKGLTEIQKRSDMIQDYFGLDRSEKDPTNYYNAFNTFRDLLKTYPDSLYAADALQRMIFIKEQLARRELAIAEYYSARGAYVSTINHTKNILYSYRSTEAFQPAMELMIRSYDRLNLEQPKKELTAIYKSTFGHEPDYLAPAYARHQKNTIVLFGEKEKAKPGTTAAAAEPEEESSWYDFMLFWRDDKNSGVPAQEGI
ncbi:MULTISPECIES: outer membrane protein assembly factor BamD [unclassified Anaerobiospirillum]|uniref:outer membrane protein assembly factor BamD n=1 Tax=unclassified Anaerobiospirillum TaxID=2647410 RepID=UPI001FF2D8B5|nr:MULTISPECIES: outer membrane protein assembly factor BamD [unclassified Anaerobiospirillum]MCK0533817.1 outer membrane protein assembly factor BamD [Anaerobiospirillum sp. NML120511]MCK0538992.1 outer membrane protein assembly factor BamD [Anaerobiospirillum sp. NML02-A-032]